MSGHDNTGGLWANTFKSKSSDPDLQGQVIVDGRVIKLIAWYTDGAGGKPKISMRVKDGTKPISHPTSTTPTVVQPQNNQKEEVDEDPPF